MRPIVILVMLLVAGLSACGQSSTARDATALRSAAVRLVFEEVNATALPGAYDRRVLRRRMGRYVASASLDRRVATRAVAIEKLGGRRYTQAWTDAITVGRWDAELRRGREAAVVFLAYPTVTAVGLPTEDLPIERFTVRMRRERGRWRLVTYDTHWLTPSGPVGDSGAETIDSLPERAVFHNPRPAR